MTQTVDFKEGEVGNEAGGMRTVIEEERVERYE